jgi:hypothetical protein
MFHFLALAMALSPGDPRVHFLGRHSSSASAARFDWVGSGFSIHLAAGTGDDGSISVDMDGGSNRFTVYRDENLVLDFFAQSGRREYNLTSASPGSRVSLIKASESNFDAKDPGVVLYSIGLNGGLDAQDFLPLLGRIDIYGDSDTASYGVDGKSSTPIQCAAHPAKYENFADGWAHQVGLLLKAELHVQAVSGIGVTRNAGDPGEAMPALVHRSLRSVDKDDYNATSWRPSAVVFYIGSNDYVLPTGKPSEAQFTAAYEALVSSVLKPLGLPAPPVVHICGPEDTPCGYIEAVANRSGALYTTTGDPGISKEGCVGHRSAPQQQTLARHLAPIIAKAMAKSGRAPE